jgi:hypothetical protein
VVISVQNVGLVSASASLTFVNRTTASGLGGNNIVTLFVDGQNVYAATLLGGLSISNNGGETFVNRTTTDGLGADAINGIWASGQNVYVATEGGLSISNNGGTTFVNNDFGRTGNSQFSYGVSVVGQNVYVGTFVGLRVSTDGGQTFTLKTSTDFGFGSGDAYVKDVQTIGSTVYAALMYLSNFGLDGGIFKSTDSGATFAPLVRGQYENVFVDGLNIVGTTASYWLFQSTNGGSSFSEILRNTVGADSKNAWISGSTLYLSTDNGLRVSNDGGQTFVTYTTSDGLGDNDMLGGVVVSGGKVYVGTKGGLSIGSGPAPTVTGVSPTSGSTAGGTAVTITGTNFTGASAVTVGGTACTNVVVVSPTSITCTTPTGNAGTSSIVVTAGGQSNVANTLFTFIAPATTTTTTVAPTTSTVAPTTTTTVPVANNATGPTLVTSANQAALTASPGKASVLVNGVAVTPQVVTASNSAAAQADPAERTPEQVRELQQAAATIETRLDTIAGGDSGVSVVRTGTGAVMTGIFSGTRVPVEDVVVVNAADTATLFAARDVLGNIVEVKPGAVLEVASNGDVAVQAFGLRPGETVELVVMSTPTLLGSFTVDAKGAIKTSAKLPTSIGSGNHSLVVASPSVKASLGLKLVKSAASLPVTGSNTNTASNWAVAVLLSGMYLVLVSRSRRRVL